MSISFPNASRAYDHKRHSVSFWGYDSAFEIAFHIEEDALRRIQPGLGGDEAGLLGAFDSHLELIHATAVKIYMRARRGSYELIPADF